MQHHENNIAHKGIFSGQFEVQLGGDWQGARFYVATIMMATTVGRSTIIASRRVHTLTASIDPLTRAPH
jgi:hypothetical protein